MATERMLMPNWARSAARVLSDKQLATLSPGQGPDDSTLTSVREAPSPLIVETIEDGGETVGGTVSRKGKFGFVCESCPWVPSPNSKPDWLTWYIGWNNKRTVGLHFPHRCKKCASRMKRWTTAARNYDRLELLRLLEGRHCLRFITLTREE